MSLKSIKCEIIYFQASHFSILAKSIVVCNCDGPKTIAVLTDDHTKIPSIRERSQLLGMGRESRASLPFPMNRASEKVERS